MGHRGQFQKGNPGGPGMTPGKRASQMVIYDLKQAARSHCAEAVEIIAQLMHSKDEKVRFMACAFMVERGYGKAEVKADVEMVHRFVEAPQVMDQAEWLARRGQPQLVAPDAATTLDLKPAPDDEKLN